jgi:hypothetical protein
MDRNFQKKHVSPQCNSADSVAGQQTSTFVCHTCQWDPQNGIYRPATWPHISGSILGNIFKVSAAYLKHANLLTLAIVVVYHADLETRAGPGPGRFPTFDFRVLAKHAKRSDGRLDRRSQQEKNEYVYLLASQVVHAKLSVNRILGPFFTGIQNFLCKFRGSAQSSGYQLPLELVSHPYFW